MVFITVANSKRILRKLDWKGLNLEGEVYDRPIHFSIKRKNNLCWLIRNF